MTSAGLPRPGASPWQPARIVAMSQLTPDIRSIIFEPQTPFVHKPGQHVDLRLVAPDGYEARRSYSIASAPDGSGQVELAVERLMDGEVSPFLHDIAEVGDEIEMRGPLGGHFVWLPAEGGPLLLLAAGSGVAPLMAMLRERQAQGSTVPVALLLSVRHRAEAPWLTELQAMAARDNGLVFRLATTRESGSDYDHRIDTQMVADLLALLPGPPMRAYLCGSNAFVNAAADGAQAAGMDAAAIRTERYGG